MDNENKKEIFVDTNKTLVNSMLVINLSFAVHRSKKANGTIRIMFSIHSVVKITVPSGEVLQIHQAPITFETGFAHIVRFSSVRNRIITVQKVRRKRRRYLVELPNCFIHTLIAAFHPFPASNGQYAYR